MDSSKACTFNGETRVSELIKRTRRTTSMQTEGPGTTSVPIHELLRRVKELFYARGELRFENLKVHEESKEYGAADFLLEGKHLQHRVSKTTPTKTGQFVTVWKRTTKGVTAPFDVSDNLEGFLITAARGDRLGQFVFPKSVLLEKGILSVNAKGGKRGMRVYAPWDVVNNKQAQTTQAWQTKYFLELQPETIGEAVSRLRALLDLS